MLRQRLQQRSEYKKSRTERIVVGSIHVLFVVFCLAFCLVSCTGSAIPVVEKTVGNEVSRESGRTVGRNTKQTRKKAPFSGVHRVRKGETLYSIAWVYGKDYKQLAVRNGIRPPYVIRPGQTLHLASARLRAPKSATTKVKPKGLVGKQLLGSWVWPARGAVVAHYNVAKGKKGIDIAGHQGQPVFSAQSGKVVYSGNGIRGYGNLLIIKHSVEYLSAYAYNSRLLVNEGDKVKEGQKIAEIGSSGVVQETRLHFEIRKGGKPVDPIKLLPKNPYRNKS